MRPLVLTAIVIIPLSQLVFASPKTTSAITAVAANPAQSCLTEVCGSPAEANFPLNLDSKLSQEYLDLSWHKKSPFDYPPHIRKITSEIEANRLKLDTNLLDRLRRSRNLGNARPRGAAKALYNLLIFSPYFKQMTKKVVKVGGISKKVIDEEASSAVLAHLPISERRWLIRVANQILASPTSEVTEEEIESKPPELLLRFLHPDRTAAEALNLEVQSMRASVVALNRSSPFERALHFSEMSQHQLEQIARRVADGTVTESETRAIINWNEKFKDYAFLRDPEHPLLQRETPTYEEIVAELGGFDAFLASFERRLTSERNLSQVSIENCKYTYFVNERALPNRAQVETLSRDVERSKQLVVDMIKTKFPASMQEGLLDGVSKVNFLLPPTASEFKRNFANTLRQERDSVASARSAYDRLPSNELRGLLIFVEWFQRRNPTEYGEVENPICDQYRYRAVSDANYINYSTVLLSYSTAKVDEVSRLALIMHEIGHSIYPEIEGGDAVSASVRKCLAEQHSEVLPPKTKAAWDEARKINALVGGPYLQEDFADEIAIASTKNVRGGNPWCQLTMTGSDGQYYHSSMQAEDESHHSSSLFRILSAEIKRKGHLPDSCEKFLRDSNFVDKFKSCFDLASPAKPVARPASGAR